jgi:NAD(P)-dependent dehydrogenase (short-subunit alcohol dehydrogenase family)/acyl carrier protein
VSRLLPQENLEPAQLEVEPEGSYLITGGLGGIGLQIARRLLKRGAHYLVLTGRGAPSKTAETAIRELEEQGCDVRVIQGDVSREADVIRLFDEMEGLDLPVLKGVVHAAGVESIVDLEDVTVEELRSVMAAKVFGTWLLDRVTRERGIELSFFVCTSSIASVWGSVKQGSYAAGNAFLTALCERRLTEDRAATAVCFGPWKEVGMGAAGEEVLGWLRSRGVRALSSSFALDGMETLIMRGVTGTALADINWPVFRALLESQRPRPLLESLGQDEDMVESLALDESRSALIHQLTEADPTERAGLLKQAIKNEMAGVLQTSADELDDGVGFFDLGMDSLMAVEFSTALSRKIGHKLPATTVMDHPDIESVTNYIIEKVLVLSSGTDEKDSKPDITAEPERDTTEKEVDELSQQEVETALDEELKDILG